MFRLDATFDSINREWGEASKILIDNILRQTTELPFRLRADI